MVCADAWTNEVLAGLGRARSRWRPRSSRSTYFAPAAPDDFAPGRLPLWIWMDDPCYYGFPTYGEATIKAAQDCGGPVVDVADPVAARLDPTPTMLRPAGRLTCASILPGSGEPVRSLRCQYTLTPDRDFVLAPVPGPRVGAWSASVPRTASSSRRRSGGSSPTSRTTGSTDLRRRRRSRLDRPALTDPAYAAHWLV